EHGVGITKKSFLPMVFSAEELALLKRIKLAFDPEGLLNPGKIFDVNPFGDFEGNSL
ncbi:MAG: FAD/FMN-containing dehydrogenase, partial [Candidatus Marinamargulisbacteria bacterium]